MDVFVVQKWCAGSNEKRQPLSMDAVSVEAELKLAINKAAFFSPAVLVEVITSESCFVESLTLEVLGLLVDGWL